MKVFDKEKALAATDGDRELLAELIDLFKEQSPDLLDAIGRAIESGQAGQLQKAAHSIKGSTGSLGAMSAHEAASALETMGMNGQLEQAEEVFMKLKRRIREFKEKTAGLEELQAK